MGKLTDLEIRTALPRTKQYKLPDGEGLNIIIRTNGSKLWQWRYHYLGKEKTLSIGCYPVISLHDARDKAFEGRKQLANGIDPSGHKQTVRAETIDAHKNTFESLARAWHQKQSKRWSAEHAETILSRLEKNVFGEIGSHPVSKLTAPIIIRVINKVEERGAHEMASRLLQNITNVLRYAVQIGKAPFNPAADLRGIVTKPKVKHQSALTQHDDIGELMRQIETYDGEELTKFALMLIALTFVRTSELRGARWQEFDFNKSEWRVPAERMKMEIEHIVPLSQQSVAILSQIKALELDSDYVFPSVRPGHGRIMSENTLLYALYRMGYHGRMTGHGFRATASTILNESNKWNSDAIERQLAHCPDSENAVRAAYNRAQFLEERRAMMQWYADELGRLAVGEIELPLRLVA